MYLLVSLINGIFQEIYINNMNIICIMFAKVIQIGSMVFTFYSKVIDLGH